jgi:hypothetical protein
MAFLRLARPLIGVGSEESLKKGLSPQALIADRPPPS